MPFDGLCGRRCLCGWERRHRRIAGGQLRHQIYGFRRRRFWFSVSGATKNKAVLLDRFGGKFREGWRATGSLFRAFGLQCITFFSRRSDAFLPIALGEQIFNAWRICRCLAILRSTGLRTFQTRDPPVLQNQFATNYRRHGKRICRALQNSAVLHRK